MDDNSVFRNDGSSRFQPYQAVQISDQGTITTSRSDGSPGTCCIFDLKVFFWGISSSSSGLSVSLYKFVKKKKDICNSLSLFLKAL